jgi:hypothetical protein
MAQGMAASDDGYCNTVLQQYAVENKLSRSDENHWIIFEGPSDRGKVGAEWN